MSKPTEYINDLQKAINQSDSFSVVSTEESGGLVDITVKDAKGDDIFIKMKDAGSYGELPMASVLQLKKVREKHPKVLLVSFSKISADIQSVFKNMGIEFLIRPTVEDTTRKLSEMRVNYSMIH
jgi:hypothetical protein